jgi:Icc-related predicted phosphoesterase
MPEQRSGATRGWGGGGGRRWWALAMACVAASWAGAAEPAAAAPAGNATPTAPEFTFVVVADPHIAEAGKDGSPSGVERWQNLVQTVLARPRPAEFMVVVGDVIPPTDPATKQPDLSVLTAAAQRLPLYLVAGNNDSVKVREVLRQTFPEQFAGRDFYSFTRHQTRFVMLCDAAAGDHYGHIASESIRGQPQWAWLEAQLKREGDVRRIFVFGHIPPHPTGADSNMYLALGDQKLLAEWVTRYAPDALFFGHCHTRQDFTLGQTPVHVLPSSHWNMRGAPPVFVEVSVFTDSVALEYVTLTPPQPAAPKP